MTPPTSADLYHIIQEALRLGAIDVLLVTTWMINGVPSDQIIVELRTKMREWWTAYDRGETRGGATDFLIRSGFRSEYDQRHFINQKDDLP